MTRYRATVPLVTATTSQKSLSGSQVMVNVYMGELLPVTVLPAEIERLLADGFIEPVDVDAQPVAA